ncbi:MAG: hypothetical protein IIY09_03005, partial [Clostridia bacterium]|nr:hypothetical protein [Clostridia bacterium]
MNGLRRKTENTNRIMTAETFGMVLALFAVLLLVVVLTGETLLGSFGAQVSGFMFGAFGYLAFAVLAGLLYAGIALVIGKRPGGKIAPEILALLTVLFCVCAFHVGKSDALSQTSFKEYCNACYAAGFGKFSQITFGGSIMGAIVYPVIKVASTVGAIVVFAFLSLFSAYGCATISKGKAEPAKREKKPRKIAQEGNVYLQRPEDIDGMKAYPNTSFDFDAEDSKQNIESNTERYFGNQPFELKTKKDYKRKDQRAESLKILYPNRGNGNLDFAGDEVQPIERERVFSQSFENKINYIKTPAPILPQHTAGRNEGVSIRPVTGTGGVPKYLHEETSRFDAEPFSAKQESPAIEQPFSRPQESFSSYSTPPRPISQTVQPLSEDDVAPTHIPASEEFPFVRAAEEPKPIVAPTSGIDFSRNGFHHGAELPGGIPAENAPRPVDPSLEEDAEEATFVARQMQPVTPVAPKAVRTERAATPAAQPSINLQKKEDLQDGEKGIDEMPLVYKYNAPPLEFMKDYASNKEGFLKENELRSRIIEDTLTGFDIPATVVNVTNGAAFTRYELSLPANISVKKVPQYADDIAMRAQAQDGVRIEAPIPGKDLVGIEIANTNRLVVGLKSIMSEAKFRYSKPSSLTFALGQNISGDGEVCDICEMPHLLVAGSTGTGKSVCLSTLIVSLICKYSPEDLRIVLVDPKQVEFSMFSGLPHLLIAEPIVDVSKAITMFNWAVSEMERRFALFKDAQVKNLEEYNGQRATDQRKLPKIVIIVDELNDLMMKNKKSMEDVIVKIAQKSRAAGIHLILATQRPSVDVITGVIKANLPSRIAFRVTTPADSVTILAEGGAEKLIGKGDLLYKASNMPKPQRLQGPFISNEEIKAIVGYIKKHNTAYFDRAVAELLNK